MDSFIRWRWEIPWRINGLNLTPSLAVYVSNDVNQFKPSVLFMGHRQTVHEQIRHRIMRCLVWIFTVCLQDVLLKIGQKWRIPPITHKVGNGHIILIRVAKSFGINGLRLGFSSSATCTKVACVGLLILNGSEYRK